ncbi:bacteriohemerythrin [Rhodoferax sp.]|uniref:bacteriohemerythrin n=1 Tax=Rhodoferax sp. TaxID=50421 RepID=UPI0027469E66|nr:hemerythrin domain-containing protein [Rhodoferax sp.]
MPNRVQWNPGYSTGNDLLDSQHQAILAQCNVLADCIANAGPQSDHDFRTNFDALMAQAGEHFATEAALLTQCAYPMLEEHQNERDEFDYLANDIITAENFESVELQRFLTLWWVGHIAGSCKKHRPFLEKLPKA